MHDVTIRDGGWSIANIVNRKTVNYLEAEFGACSTSGV